jgi:hypothetical protein
MDNFTLLPVSGPLASLVRNGTTVYVDYESLIGMPIKTVDGIIIGQINRIDKDTDTWYGTIIAKYLEVGEPVSMEMVLEAVEKKTADVPIKTGNLCERCIYNFERNICNCGVGCCGDNPTCPIFDFGCHCLKISVGDPCEHFKEATDEKSATSWKI